MGFYGIFINEFDKVVADVRFLSISFIKERIIKNERWSSREWE